jgi:hypothetical protein
MVYQVAPETSGIPGTYTPPPVIPTVDSTPTTNLTNVTYVNSNEFRITKLFGDGNDFFSRPMRQFQFKSLIPEWLIRRFLNG